MPKLKKDKDKDNEHEERIEMEIVVDAYDRWERMLGWYYYLDEKPNFPFKAECIKKSERSPLKKGEKVEVGRASF